MRRGFVKEYKGCKIHYVQERFVVTDEHGATIHETRWGLPIVEDWIDENTTNGKLNDNIQE